MATPVTAANFALVSGWGAGATISGVFGTQRRCQLTLTAGTTPSVGPQFRFTYPDGSYPLEPGILAKQVSGTGQFTDLTYQPGQASTVFTFLDLPETGQTYVFDLDTLGL